MGQAILTAPCIALVILHTKYTGRRETEFNVDAKVTHESVWDKPEGFIDKTTSSIDDFIAPRTW